MNGNKINLKGISKQNIITLLVLILALTNSILSMCGVKVLPITNDDINNIVSAIFLIGSALYSTYKNFNVSTAAQTAQTLCDAIKQGAVVIDEVTNLVELMKANETDKK